VIATVSNTAVPNGGSVTVDTELAVTVELLLAVNVSVMVIFKQTRSLVAVGGTLSYVSTLHLLHAVHAASSLGGVLSIHLLQSTGHFACISSLVKSISQR
jgi:hypothetical protein